MSKFLRREDGTAAPAQPAPSFSRKKRPRDDDDSTKDNAKVVVSATDVSPGCDPLHKRPQGAAKPEANPEANPEAKPTNAPAAAASEVSAAVNHAKLEDELMSMAVAPPAAAAVPDVGATADAADDDSEQFCTMGVHSTGRAEATHSAVKRFLHKSMLIN